MRRAIMSLFSQPSGPYLFSPRRVANATPRRRGPAIAAAVLGVLSVFLVLFGTLIFVSFIPGTPWYEPCGLQGVALIIPIGCLPVLGAVQRYLADRAGLAGIFGSYGIYSALGIIGILFLGGVVATLASIAWAGYGVALSVGVVVAASRTPHRKANA